MMDNLSEELKTKLDKLEGEIRKLGSLAVGFSGGVDSTFLLTVAHNVLGDKAIAVTSADASVPQREIDEAKDFCAVRGIRQFFCTADPLSIE
ncbi:MAG: TIGR00268 family protein, partial [Lachnospiraceae bacterium]|nr:TIGR00268 family protein [Lachnospiraceae bacterium]